MTKLPPHWQLVRFGELVSSKDSLRIPLKGSDRAVRRGQIPYYGASGIIDYIDEYIFDGEHLLVAEDGANLLSRSSPITFTASGRFWVNNHAHVLVPNGAATLQYLLQFLSHLDLKPYITGTAQPKLTYASLARIPILLPPLAEQQRIAAILDQAEALRAKRRHALAKLDTLTQSLFLEMFGDLERHNWPEKSVAALANNIRTGPFGSQLLHSEFVGSGIAVLGIDNAVQNQFVWGRPRFITEHKFRQLRRYQVSPGDVLITIMGTCGRCAVVPDDIPTAINTKHLCCITLDHTQCLSTYLHACFLLHPHVLHRLGIRERGAVMPGLNMQVIKELVIPVPPLPLQHEFALQVDAVERLKTAQRTSLAKLDALFASLQHRAFRGEI